MEKTNRTKLFDVFQADTNGLIYLRGGSVSHRYNTDFEFAFRQESNFLYVTGITEPDFQVILDLKDHSWHLVIPRRDAKYAVWMGRVNPPEYYKEHYGPDSVLYDDQLELVFSKRAPDTVFCLSASDAGHLQDSGFNINTETLPEAMAYCRSIKSDEELAILRKASDVASEAHRAAMKMIPTANYEYEVKAAFEYVTQRNGMLHQPYGGIFASGSNSSILHYVQNNAPIDKKGHFMIDAGAENKGYAADITRTFPANGTFSEPFSTLYDITLKALVETTNAARPGVKMEDLQLHASRVILEGLKDAGYIHGEVEDMMQVNLFALFFPHGLGHFLGLDTHDVGGYLKGVEPIDRPGLRFLRARRTLEKGMVITIEPGLYMIPALLEPAFKDPKYSPFLHESRLRKMLDFGGIRIEDDLIITDTGVENMTTVPKKRSEIEALMKG